MTPKLQQTNSNDSRYRLKVYNEFGLADDETKEFVGSFSRWQRKDIPGLGDRIKTDKLVESDLFILKEWLKDIIAMNGTTYKFEVV
jgi:hypothetical protein